MLLCRHCICVEFRRALEPQAKQCFHISHHIGLHRLSTAHTPHKLLGVNKVDARESSQVRASRVGVKCGRCRMHPVLGCHALLTMNCCDCSAAPRVRSLSWLFEQGAVKSLMEVSTSTLTSLRTCTEKTLEARSFSNETVHVEPHTLGDTT